MITEEQQKKVQCDLLDAINEADTDETYLMHYFYYQGWAQGIHDQGGCF